MPPRIPRPCCKPNCPATTTDRSGYCEQHKPEETGWNRHNRGKSAHQRGYGAAWRKLRKQVLTRDQYVCQACRKRSANEVDHIIPKSDGGTDALDNLQAICTQCHRDKTNRERSANR